MRVRGLLLTALFAALIPEAALGADAPQAPTPRSLPATRAEVLAGTASPPRTFELLKTSIEAAGGEAVQATAEEALGGYAHPLLAADLDGDGNEEALLQQYVDRPYLVAVDDGAVLWRARLAKRAWVAGTLKSDFTPGGGEEVLVILYRWRTGKVTFLNAGQHGVLWRSRQEHPWFELNGVAQADTDPESEIALTFFDDSTVIRTYDGEDGEQLGELSSSLEERTGRRFWTEAFVTDGPGDGPDEAVFVTHIYAGLYAERQSLTDGEQVDYNVLPGANQVYLGQGPDYTGDGRRDGYISSVSLSAERVGVFDASTLDVAWTRTIPVTPGMSEFHIPIQLGVAQEEAAQDLCLQTYGVAFDDEGERITKSAAGFRCYDGTAGTDVWQASVSAEVPSEGPEGWAFAYGSANSDLDGDGVIDPFLESMSGRCYEETPDAPPTCERSYEAEAVSGRDGSVLWTVENEYGFFDQLTGANLDGRPGDDIMRAANAPSDRGAVFAIMNGLTQNAMWFGQIDTAGPYTYATYGLDPDLDGDGTAEALITAQAFVGIGEPICEVWDGQEFCWYEDYEDHAYLAAFRPRPSEGFADRLWQFEL